MPHAPSDLPPLHRGRPPNTGGCDQVPAGSTLARIEALDRAVHSFSKALPGDRPSRAWASTPSTTPALGPAVCKHRGAQQQGTLLYRSAWLGTCSWPSQPRVKSSPSESAWRWLSKAPSPQRYRRCRAWCTSLLRAAMDSQALLRWPGAQLPLPPAPTHIGWRAASHITAAVCEALVCRAGCNRTHSGATALGPPGPWNEQAPCKGTLT